MNYVNSKSHELSAHQCSLISYPGISFMESSDAAVLLAKFQQDFYREYPQQSSRYDYFPNKFYQYFFSFFAFETYVVVLIRSAHRGTSNEHHNMFL